MKYFLLLFFLFLLGNFYLICSDYTVQLPQEQNIYNNNKPLSSNWIEFKKSNNNWTLINDGLTGNPEIAYGKPIQINGFKKITDENIIEAINTFINSNNNIFPFKLTDLSVQKIVKVKNSWAISFVQIHNGLEVLLSKVEFKIRDDGKIIAFSIKYFDNIKFDSDKKISRSEIIQAARFDMPKLKTINELQISSNEYILPIITNDYIIYQKVIKVIVPETDDLNSYKWTSYVNSTNGSLVWRTPLTLDAEFKIENSVKLSKPSNSESVVPLADCFVNIDSKVYETNKYGAFEQNLQSGQIYSYGFKGPWCFVNIEQMTKVPNTIINDTLKENDVQGFSFLFDSSNSNSDERYLFYYTNKAHDFYKETDPDSKAMDFQCQVFTTYQGQPNAASDLQTGNIIFYNVNNTATKFVETPSVLYHEYGHSQNQRLYKEMGISSGMINLSCHEAMADINSALILDESKVGLGAWVNTPDKFIRNVENENKYPQDISGDSHITGLILAGTFWDIKKELSIDTVRNLVHYTKKYGTPDDDNIGKAFGKWFWETLLADDVFYGDADISNGTPHFKTILNAFNKHNIGLYLLLRNSFSHTQYQNTDNTTEDYNINFKLGVDLSFIDSKPKNVKLVYFINKLSDEVEVDAVETSPMNWEAKIPAQPRGTVIYYYIKAEESITNSKLEFRPLINNGNYTFIVGYNTSLVIDFNKNDADWKVGNINDNSTTGIWEYGVPQPYYLYYQYYGTSYPIQPKGGHNIENPSDSTGACWATGIDNGGDYTRIIQQFVPQGITTLESPVYDISRLKNPIIDYWRWFTTMQIRKTCNWKVYLSNDAGDTWEKVDSTGLSNFSVWGNYRILISNFFDKPDKLKIRFVFEGFPTNISLGEGAVDDVQILSGNDETINDIKENVNSYVIASPNPVENILRINYNLKFSGNTEISLYNLLGEKIRTLENRYKIAGSYQDDFDISELKSGSFIIKIQNSGENRFIKIIKR